MQDCIKSRALTSYRDGAARCSALPEQRDKLKTALGLDAKRPLTVFIGGGQGAKQINDAVALHLKELLGFTNVVLLSGTAQYDELKSLTPVDDPRFILKDFISSGMPELLGAADVVVSRAGATFLLELAALDHVVGDAGLFVGADVGQAADLLGHLPGDLEVVRGVGQGGSAAAEDLFEEG